MTNLPPDNDDLILTPRGRQLIQTRLTVIDDELRHLASLPWNGRAGDEIALQREQLTAEWSVLQVALEDARPVETVPEDPGAVLVGDRVQVRVGHGPVESFVVVHPIEAALDDGCVSTASPLGRAIVGSLVGADVQVRASSGTYRCKILRSERA